MATSLTDFLVVVVFDVDVVLGCEVVAVLVVGGSCVVVLIFDVVVGCGIVGGGTVAD